MAVVAILARLDITGPVLPQVVIVVTAGTGGAVAWIAPGIGRTLRCAAMTASAGDGPAVMRIVGTGVAEAGRCPSGGAVTDIAGRAGDQVPRRFACGSRAVMTAGTLAGNRAVVIEACG